MECQSHHKKIHMKEHLKLIENRLKELIPNSPAYHKKLFDAATYSLFSSGKRLRPMLVLATVEAFDKDLNLAIDPACSIELIHTYSLIHDDLPCMDDDDMRRGKPTLHKAYPEWLAVLTGDYLLTYAFEIISNAKALSSKQKVNLINTLSKYSGSKGLIAGQVADLFWENKKIDFEKLKFMHLNKTAALFIASVEFGCIVAKATKKIKSKFLEFAKNMGLSFQIFDDISDSQIQSSDIEKNKATAVTILGLDKAKDLAIDLQKKALDILKKLPLDTSYLEKLSLMHN